MTVHRNTISNSEEVRETVSYQGVCRNCLKKRIRETKKVYRNKAGKQT